jgi:glycosyltransferase involved in cell wall biosynthesis
MGSSLKKTLLISCFACSPNMGSEFAVSWGYLQNISKYYSIIVFVGTTEGDLISCDMNKLKIAGVEFHQVTMSGFGKLLHYFSCKLGLAWLWPLCLRSWNRRVFIKARKITQIRKVDLVHQLNPIGFKNPGNLWRLPIPSYWGPVGGFLKLNTQVALKQGFKYKCVASIWNFFNYLSAKDFFIAKAARKYTFISFATAETQNNFKKHYDVTGPVIPEVATDEQIIDCVKSEYKAIQTLKLVSVGSLIWRKNIQQILDALIMLQTEKEIYRVELHIFGDGPLKPILYEKTNGLLKNINVIFHGYLDRQVMLEKIASMDSILVTSLAEGNSSAVLEAVSLGLIPIVPLAHGFKTTLSEAGLFYDQKLNYDDQNKQIVAHIKYLYDRKNRVEMRSKVLLMARKITYKKIINLHRNLFEDRLPE